VIQKLILEAQVCLG